MGMPIIDAFQISPRPVPPIHPMYQSFDGNFKKKRQIKLGGSSDQAATREQLLRNAQMERLQREQARLRVESISKIQVKVSFNCVALLEG